MANTEHLNILRQGVRVWNQWRHDNPDVIPDLTDIDLTTKESAGACWDEHNKRANLATANLQTVNLQRAILISAILRKAELQGADLSEAIMNDTDCRGVIASKARFNLVEAVGANFRGAELDGVVLDDGNWAGASFAGANLTGTLLKGNFAGADLRNCDKYFQDWNTTVSGAPNVPPNYPFETPVELIVGLNPRTRRMLADGLYIKALWERSRKLNRFGLRIWGLSCGYGQSLTRWVILSLGFILFASAVETQLRMNFANHHTLIVKSDAGVVHQSVSQIDQPTFEQAIYHSVVTFATLGYGDVTPMTFIGRLWVIMVVCAGYIMLGGLVSIFATKLGRLG